MSELLKPGHERADMKTVGMALSRGWVIPDVVKLNLIKRLNRLVVKGTDDLALKAGELLRKIVESNEATVFPVAAPQVNVQVNNGGAIVENTDAGGGRVSAIIERVRAARISGDGD